MYKGEDLDLRTPHAASRNAGLAGSAGASSGWLSRAFENAGEREPLWVDDTVLALCNKAFDLAVALGADEVRLEHLVHALTQLDATSDVLVDHNIHVSTLRRESAAIILEEIPAQQAPNSKTARQVPRKSDEFEDVLLKAAEAAYARRSPVTTEDILATLFDMSRDNTTRNLLSRHRAEFDLRHDSETMPARHAATSSASNTRMNEPRTKNPPTVTDTVQNTRIDALERQIRDLGQDMAANRDSIATLIDELRAANSDRVATVVETQPAPRTTFAVNDEPHLSDGHEMLYLIGRMERSVEQKFNELARTWRVLGDRLDSLERAVDTVNLSGGGAGDISAVEQRFDRIENVLTALPQRFSEMERRFQTTGSASVDLAPVTSKLNSIERLISESPEGNFELAPLSNEIREVDDTLRGIGAQIKSVESRTGDVNLLVDSLSERVERMETLIDNQRVQTAQLGSGIGKQIQELGTSLRAQSAGGEGMQEMINRAVQGVAGTFERQKTEISTSVTSAVSERFAGLQSLMQNRQSDNGQALQAIQTRLVALEQAVRSVSEGGVVVNGEGGLDKAFVHDALSKIVTNQQTIAGSIDDWRSEAKTDIGTIKTRMDALERPSSSPALAPGDMQKMQENLERLRSTLAERQDPWTQFRLWLYGTDDWYGASWGHLQEDGYGRSSYQGGYRDDYGETRAEAQPPVQPTPQAPVARTGTGQDVRQGYRIDQPSDYYRA